MVCEDAQGNKFMVKAFNSSDNFLKLEEVTYLLIQLECFNEYLEKCTRDSRPGTSSKII